MHAAANRDHIVIHVPEDGDAAADGHDGIGHPFVGLDGDVATDIHARGATAPVLFVSLIIIVVALRRCGGWSRRCRDFRRGGFFRRRGTGSWARRCWRGRRRSVPACQGIRRKIRHLQHQIRVGTKLLSQQGSRRRDTVDIDGAATDLDHSYRRGPFRLEHRAALHGEYVEAAFHALFEDRVYGARSSGAGGNRSHREGHE